MVYLAHCLQPPTEMFPPSLFGKGQTWGDLKGQKEHLEVNGSVSFVMSQRACLKKKENVIQLIINFIDPLGEFVRLHLMRSIHY